MCGIFGFVSQKKYSSRAFSILAEASEQRGRDSSGLLFYNGQSYEVYRSNHSITHLKNRININPVNFVMGHSRLVTNGLADNQPVIRDGICVIHNGIIVNCEKLWPLTGKQRLQEIDTEIIPAIAAAALERGEAVETIPEQVLKVCEGVVACAMVIPSLGKLCLFSNNGSLYVGSKAGITYFSSESFPLTALGCANVEQVKDAIFIDLPVSADPIVIDEAPIKVRNLIPSLGQVAQEESLLHYRNHNLRRCTKCLLTETMPYIRFDEKGVCNYCHNYKPRNKPRPVEEIFQLVDRYRRDVGSDCIVPFSGGRDSCYGLHLIVDQLKMKPVTYTYDWGMVTDLGRRNISRMCAKLGVENIIVADDIGKKRRNIAMNLKAWLKSPHLGMISILTAGDKHFFRHVETIKKQTGISLNLWGVNPLEVTHFKAGFLGVPPDFEEERVYSHGVMKQLRYQYLRLKAMLKSPGYFNNSLWDTLSGEYYRSFTKKSDYYHIFDYWRWDEKLIDKTLEEYDWEKAPDTNTTWRIGDGTAAFYNYIYYTVAGFTEHDTFRSNQIREGDLSREEALELVLDENRPRYPNIKWYLDAIDMDYKHVVNVINNMPQMY